MRRPHVARLFLTSLAFGGFVLGAAGCSSDSIVEASGDVLLFDERLTIGPDASIWGFSPSECEKPGFFHATTDGNVVTVEATSLTNCESTARLHLEFTSSGDIVELGDSYIRYLDPSGSSDEPDTTHPITLVSLSEFDINGVGNGVVSGVIGSDGTPFWAIVDRPPFIEMSTTGVVELGVGQSTMPNPDCLISKLATDSHTFSGNCDLDQIMIEPASEPAETITVTYTGS